jgi:hypothetical protein
MEWIWFHNNLLDLESFVVSITAENTRNTRGIVNELWEMNTWG